MKIERVGSARLAPHIYIMKIERVCPTGGLSKIERVCPTGAST
jgi:hypothetical protein